MSCLDVGQSAPISFSQSRLAERNLGLLLSLAIPAIVQDRRTLSFQGQPC
jgi:hypothetical protein